MSFLAVFLVNNSLSGRWLFLTSRLTIVSLDKIRMYRPSFSATYVTVTAMLLKKEHVLL